MACLLDVEVYPHIVERIVRLAPFEAQIPLRATCHAYRHIIEADWCRHICVKGYDDDTGTFLHPVLLKPIPCLPWPRYDRVGTVDAVERTLDLLKTHVRVCESINPDGSESGMLPDSYYRQYPFENTEDLFDEVETGMAVLLVVPDVIPHTISIHLNIVDEGENPQLVIPYRPDPIDDSYGAGRKNEEVVVLLWDGPVVPPSFCSSSWGLDYRKWANEHLTWLLEHLEKHLLRGGKVTVVHSSSRLDAANRSPEDPEGSTQLWGDFVYALFFEFLQQHSLDTGQVVLITQDEHRKQVKEDYYEKVVEHVEGQLAEGLDEPSENEDLEEYFEYVP